MMRPPAGIRSAAALAAFVLAAVALVAAGCGNAGPASSSESSRGSSSAPASSAAGSRPADPTPEEPPPPAPETPFVQQAFKNNKTIHFVSSDPPNNALLSAPPPQVTVRFSSDLGSGSFISVKVDGREVTTGGMILPLDNRSVSVVVNPYAAGTGNYAVNYAAYWSDGSYCEGSFGFSVKLP